MKVSEVFENSSTVIYDAVAYTLGVPKSSGAVRAILEAEIERVGKAGFIGLGGLVASVLARNRTPDRWKTILSALGGMTGAFVALKTMLPHISEEFKKDLVASGYIVASVLSLYISAVGIARLYMGTTNTTTFGRVKDVLEIMVSQGNLKRAEEFMGGFKAVTQDNVTVNIIVKDDEYVLRANGRSLKADNVDELNKQGFVMRFVADMAAVSR